MNYCRIGRQDGKGAGALSGPGQFEHQIVSADQQIGLAVLRQFQKHLVIRVAAFGQRWQGRAVCAGAGQHRQMRLITLQQISSTGGIQPELRIAGNALQLSQGAVVGQADDSAIVNGFSQRGQRRRFEMKQIHYDIGIEYQSRRGYHG